MTTEEHQIAVWLDHSKAHFITFNQKDPVIETLFSNNIPQYREDGQSADGTHLSQNIATNNEHHKHNQERDDARYYFKVIADRLKDYNVIHLFGPSTAKNELNNFLYDEKISRNKMVTVNTTDNLTENQMIAEARKYFDMAENM